MVDRLIKKVEGRRLNVHPTCFYLDWLHKDGPRATWIPLTEVPKGQTVFSSYVKWKDLRYDVMLATNYQGEHYSVQAENPYKNVSYLKSHLQKVMRRSNTYKALKTAWHFLDLDLHEFLRRLAIIAVEDCLPMQGYSILIWLLAGYTKGYIISDIQIAWCLGYVHDLSKCKYYEQFDHHGGSKEDLPTVRQMRVFTLPQEGKDLVYSILFRQSYGGMKGDQAMCRVAALSWANRYHTKSLHLEHLQRKTIYITPPYYELQQGEWVLAALDFHCCPNIIGSLWEKHDEYTEEEIKNAIWHCSSSITNKALISEDLGQRDTEKYKDIWKVIRKDMQGYAKFVLEKMG